MERVISKYGESAIDRAELAETILNTQIGTPFYIATRKFGLTEEEQQELDIGIKALETGELINNGGESNWSYEELGASEEFWSDAIK